MKKLFCIAAFAAALGLSGCNTFFGVNLTDQASVDKLLPSRLEKFIDPQATVYEIFLVPSADFSLSMGSATVEFLAPGATEAQKFTVDMSGNQKPRESKISDMPSFDPVLRKMVKRERTTENGIKLHDIDFSKIAAIVNEASKMLSDEGHATDGLNGLTLTFNGNPDETTYKFAIQTKQGTEMGQQHGRSTLVTEYYEFPFEADARGTVTYTGE